MRAPSPCMMLPILLSPLSHLVLVRVVARDALELMWLQRRRPPKVLGVQRALRRESLRRIEAEKAFHEKSRIRVELSEAIVDRVDARILTHHASVLRPLLQTLMIRPIFVRWRSAKIENQLQLPVWVITHQDSSVIEPLCEHTSDGPHVYRETVVLLSEQQLGRSIP